MQTETRFKVQQLILNITVEGSSIIIIYVDATQGWVITDASKAADISQQALFTVATGGTITERQVIIKFIPLQGQVLYVFHKLETV